MRSHALAPLLVILATGCGQSSGDYAAVVTWAINGMLPNPALCAEQGIARGRLEVRTEGGKALQTLETDCSATVIAASDGLEFGGFVTSPAFEWGVPYRYTVSLVDQNGQDRADAISGPLYETDYAELELPTIDYLQPKGNVARLEAEWSINNSATLADASTCGDIATVRLLISSILDTEFVNELVFLQAPCSEGRIAPVEPVLATGVYNIRYEALGPRGNPVQLGEPIEVVVDVPGDIALPRQNFLAGQRLTVQNN